MEVVIVLLTLKVNPVVVAWVAFQPNQVVPPAWLTRHPCAYAVAGQTTVPTVPVVKVVATTASTPDLLLHVNPDAQETEVMPLPSEDEVTGVVEGRISGAVTGDGMLTAELPLDPLCESV